MIGLPNGYNYAITDIDADWDDESGKVQLRLEVSAMAGGPPNNLVNITGITFQVSVLAALPSQ